MGAIAAGAAAIFPRLFPMAFAVGTAAVTATFPILVMLLTNPTSPNAVYAGFSESAVHRILIWQNTAIRIHENPILGYGFDTARALYRDAGAQWITMLPSTPEARLFLPSPFRCIPII